MLLRKIWELRDPGESELDFMLRTIAYYEAQRDADDLEDESIWETVEATAGDGIDSDDDDGDGSLPLKKLIPIWVRFQM